MVSGINFFGDLYHWLRNMDGDLELRAWLSASGLENTVIPFKSTRFVMKGVLGQGRVSWEGHPSVAKLRGVWKGGHYVLETRRGCGAIS